MKYILPTIVILTGIFMTNIATAKDIEPPKNRNMAQGLTNPYNVNTKFIEKGKKIYKQNCASCHTATGDQPDYHPLSVMARHHAEGDYLWVVTYGLNKTMGPGVMPPWQDKLSVEERWAVVSYIREVLGK